MGKYVRIQSTKPITVTAGLQTIDMTNEASTNPDKLNVKPSWTAFRVQIKRGTGYYPARIKDWPSIKVLSDKQILTVGEITDIVPEEFKKEAEEVTQRVEYEYSKYEKQLSARQQSQAKEVKKSSPKKQKEETLFDED